MNNSNIVYIVLAFGFLMLAGLATQAKSQAAQLVDDVCLGCICEAASGCNQTKPCTEDICGIFRITWFYWADSGKLTLNEESVESPTAFEDCATDASCATRSVQNYMQTFQQDCNGDHKIDCYDYAIIHKNGGYSCPSSISGSYAKKLNLCLESYSIATSTPEETTTKDTGQSSDAIKPIEVPQITMTPQGNITKMLEVPIIEDFVETFDFVPDFNNQTTEKVPASIVKMSLINAIDIVNADPPNTKPTIQSSPIKSDPTKEMLNDLNIPNIQKNVTKMVDVYLNKNFAETSTAPSTESPSPESPSTESNDQTTRKFIFTKRKFVVKTTTTKSPPLSPLEYLYPEENMTTPSFLESEKVVMPEITLESPVLILSEKDGNSAGVNEKNQSSVSGLSGSNDTQSRKSSQDRFFDLYERIQQSKNDQTLKDLNFKEMFLEAFVNKNRIEKERNEILKQIAENNKAIESSHDRFFNKLEEREKSEKEHRMKQLKFQEQFLEAFLNNTRIGEERNKVLKEIANNNRPSDLTP